MEARINIIGAIVLFLSAFLVSSATGEDLAFCLSSSGVKNFTTYYTTGDYLRLLNISIMNLRYAKPFVNKPVAVVLPGNKEQVAAAIRCSTSASWTIRLRSGGHSYEGLSSRDDGPFVLIDLMNMNRVSVDLDAETAWAEGGATLGEIYYAIATSSKRYGFSGGMCATVSRSGSPSDMAKLLHKWQTTANNVLEDDYFLQLAALPGSSSNQSAELISVFFSGLYLGPKASALAITDRVFPELNLTAQECAETTWAEGLIIIRGDNAVRTVEDLKNRFSYQKMFTKTKFDYVETPIPLSALESALKMLTRQPRASVLFDVHGGAMYRIPSDATPFPHRAGTLYGIEYFVDWPQEEDADYGVRYMKGLRRLYEFMTPFVSKNPRRSYVNSVDLDLGAIDWTDEKQLCRFDAVEVARAWGEKYFLGNYDRLVRAKTLIDPNNVFRHPQSIPPFPTKTLTRTGH
ncbi:hypothetical protein H6P81_009078 [Aristolochia fimbriata]|uniref:FAD-binding PCMH-type domain-containing protein n=1 Tax=Aristolochia fimbriata TaxID=158543 RepID=A0AAV7EK16_ARIFI|nr:hypothetical protein H6P81_009078 [Aristolochia fimbriata]